MANKGGDCENLKWKYVAWYLKKVSARKRKSRPHPPFWYSMQPKAGHLAKPFCGPWTLGSPCLCSVLPKRQNSPYFASWGFLIQKVSTVQILLLGNSWQPENSFSSSQAPSPSYAETALWLVLHCAVCNASVSTAGLMLLEGRDALLSVIIPPWALTQAGHILYIIMRFKCIEEGWQFPQSRSVGVCHRSLGISYDSGSALFDVIGVSQPRQCWHLGWIIPGCVGLPCAL